MLIPAAPPVNAGTPMDQQIIRAIRGRRVLSLIYQGRPIDLEPYIYGRMTSGKVFLFGWQRTGLLSIWRVLWPALARNIQVTEERFDTPRSDYSPVMIGRVAEVYAQAVGITGPALAPRRVQA